MNADIPLAGAALQALPSGALFWPEEHLLCVSDLHLGKAERIARGGGPLLPPFENTITLAKLADDIAATAPHIVICLGDSFDDLQAAQELDQSGREQLMALQAGRHWLWIEGNHDPGPLDLGGDHLAEARIGPLTFRHIAQTGATGEVSGHYHPKFAPPGFSARPAFLFDAARLILPAYGAFTGGLSARDPALAALVSAPAWAVLTGRRALKLPLSRSDPDRPAPAGSCG